MTKKLIIVWLSMTVLIFSTVVAHADTTVQGKFLNRNIYINGKQIDNFYLEDPLFIHKGVTYFPLSATMQELLGFRPEINQESRTIQLVKTAPTRTALGHKMLKSNLGNPTVLALDRYLVTARVGNTGGNRTNSLPGLQGFASVPIDISPYQVLKKNKVFYLPLRAMTTDPGFRWSLHYDDYSGVYISTNPGTPAKTYFDKKESQYNKGLANYIRHRNNSVTAGNALNLVFLFKHEGKVYDVDETLLMAMAEKESTFRVNCVAKGDAIGLMQILSRTAAAHGVSRSQLFDPHINIQFGAKYLSERMKKYGVTSTALSAYNKGSVPVNRGTAYTTRYSNRIIKAEDALTGYLVKNGYGLGK
jgi:hypothetical protein